MIYISMAPINDFVWACICMSPDMDDAPEVACKIESANEKRETLQQFDWYLHDSMKIRCFFVNRRFLNILRKNILFTAVKEEKACTVNSGT